MNKSDQLGDRQKLANLITQWNLDHYDLFELSPPNESLEFHGVVRFYFQDEDHNVVTKCIRVSSTATTKEVVDVLVEKFRPDMRMLTANKYSLYEVHIGEERKLHDEERVLYVQLSWGKDVREGRFLLRRDGAPAMPEKETGSGFKRKLSKREKKEKKKADKERKMNKENMDKNAGVADQLYTDAPETSFTRSISNPDAVMRRRRQQKLEKKLQQFHGQNGQGGTLKIYGETLRPDVPYKTLLLSTADQVSHVIKEAMEKYAVDTEDTTQFVLVEVLVPPGEREYHGGTIGEERIMDEEECPLAIAMRHPPSRGMLMFQLKRKNADMIKPKNKRQRAVSHEDLRSAREPSSPSSMPPNKLPFLLQLNPDGTENLKGRVHRLHMDVTKVGRERSTSTNDQCLQLFGPNIQPRHCVIGHSSGIVTVTPTTREAETYVNQQRITETTLLKHGMTVTFGKSNMFRFYDPAWEERKAQNPPDGMVRQNSGQLQGASRPAETNFDMDGRVETMPDGSRPQHPQRQESRQSGMSSVHGSVHGSSNHSHDEMPRASPRELSGNKFDDALPAMLEFRDERENDLLSTVILDTNVSATQFKLSPTYTLYLAVRYRLSSTYRPDLSPSDRAHKLTSLVNKIAQLILQAIQESRDNPAALAFWMANASEILHFFKQDHDIHLFSQDCQEMLAEAVQMAFHHLVRCLQYDLQRTLPAFLDDADSDGEDLDERSRFNRNKPTMMDILDTLSSAMNLLRRCRVNAALTIQLFSQLFHFINMWVFNILVTEKQLQLCTRTWGVRLKRRLGRVEAWAEKQGLELAADCHLCRIIQAAHLLQAPKSSPDDIANISSTCFKLNSLQLREFLERYSPDPGEPPIPHNLIDRVVSVAENMADQLLRSDGRQVQLEEDQDLQLPFLLPEDGYSCDTIKGVPNGLGEYIEPLTRGQLCRMTLQPHSSGLWTVYMSDDEPSQIIEESLREKKERTPEPRQQPQQALNKEPEVIIVTFNKVKGSMGLSIVAAKGDGQRERGIYIKSVVPEGAAALDGRLQAGDQLIEVDTKSLIGLTQEKAAELMTKTGQVVTLKVAKQGAIYHGLATLLSQPSPIMQRASPQKTPMTPNKQRPQDEGPPPYNGVPENERRPGMTKADPRSLPRDLRNAGLRGPDSRSSPALNSNQLSAQERLRAPSAGNLSGGQNPAHQSLPPQHPAPKPHGHFNRRGDNRDMDKSKSIPNLHMDNSFDGRPDASMMRPAQSVSALQHQRNPNNVDYYNQPHSLDESRTPDYENQPIDPRLHPQDPNRGYPGAGQPSPNMQYPKPNMQPTPNSMGPPHAGQAFERPQSQYFGQHMDRPDFTQGRPKSEEFSVDRLRQLQDMDRSQGSSNDQSFENKAPNYSNIRPQPNYANHGEIRKMDVNNQARQSNFYENTVARQQDPTPPFQQLRRPPSEGDKPRPAPKPSVAPKPNQPMVQPAEIPRSEVDNRATQPHFYNPRAQDRLAQNANPQQQSFNTSPNSQSHYQNTNFHDKPKNAFGQDGYHKNSSPLNEIPPELPPPPSMDELQDEDLPPLPPPPVTDYRLEQKIREEMRMQPADPSYSNLPPQNSRGQPMMQTNGQRSPQERLSYPGNQSLPFSSGYHPNSVGFQPPLSAGFQPKQMQQPQSLPSQPTGYQPSHDYQNIAYPNKSLDTTTNSQPPPQNLYESYDPRKQQANFRPAIHKQIKEQRDAIVSPWQREEKEKQQKQQETDLNHLREMEILELESRPHRSPQEEERLRKLKLDHEFQRRLQEVSGKDDEDEESDSDDRFLTSRLSIQTMQEDLVKSRMRMQELEQKRLYEDMDKEKERMQRLERRIEMFEREREEQKQRQSRRLEKQQKEQEDYLRKQKEAREQHKREIEENLRQQKLEEEKLQQRKLAEEQRRKEMERQRLKEIQAQKEAEEAAAREQIRRQEEEYQRQQIAEQERRRRDEEREIRVAEERKRYDAKANQQNMYYSQYENLPPHGSSMQDPRYAPNQYGPPPPERNSSYLPPGSRGSTSRPEDQMDRLNGGYRVNSSSTGPSSPFRGSQENIPSKKSVSFNPHVNSQSRELVEPEPRHSPPSSYQPFQRAYISPNQNYTSPSYSPSVPVSSVNTSMNNNNVEYKTQESTPTVIGSQEVYRDPRARIEAKMANKNKQNTDRLSFRDKMKFFASEAGETTPVNKPKASTTQRRIESQILYNGQ